jgi:hypothetical protein
MVAIDYRNILRRQYEEIGRDEWKIKFFSPDRFNSFINSFFSLNSWASKLNNSLSTELISVKGLLADLEENQELIKDKDLIRKFN